MKNAIWLNNTDPKPNQFLKSKEDQKLAPIITSGETIKTLFNANKVLSFLFSLTNCNCTKSSITVAIKLDKRANKIVSRKIASSRLSLNKSDNDLK